MRAVGIGALVLVGLLACKPRSFNSAADSPANDADVMAAGGENDKKLWCGRIVMGSLRVPSFKKVRHYGIKVTNVADEKKLAEVEGLLVCADRTYLFEPTIDVSKLKTMTCGEVRNGQFISSDGSLTTNVVSQNNERRISVLSNYSKVCVPQLQGGQPLQLNQFFFVYGTINKASESSFVFQRELTQEKYVVKAQDGADINLLESMNTKYCGVFGLESAHRYVRDGYLLASDFSCE